MDMNIKRSLRPCFIVTNRIDPTKRKALFHRWGQLAKNIPISGGNAHQVAEVCGVVEFEDGTVKTVRPNQIKFLDSTFDEYDWSEREV